MNQEDLHSAITAITRKLHHFDYPINNQRTGGRIIESNIATGLWETYTIDERGGKHNLQTFDTEEEACAYILDDAIKSMKIIINSYSDAVRRAYLE
ncbi:MAG: hypothetical protein LBV18_03845 [Alistipes sp.]|jgi:hypothetical protein|nr:hypothetical protein [Alistipes sp.]